MEEQTFQVGAKVLVQCNAPAGTHGVFFEDDGETGYFYAVDLARPSDVIVDAVHIYDVAKVVDRERPCALSIVWSEDVSKCALLIDRYPHAAFDFSEKRGYCRTNSPNFRNPADGSWLTSDHQWSDDAVAWLSPERPRTD